MPAGARPGAPGEDGKTEQRLAALEQAVAALGGELRTRRLVVAAGDRGPRIVCEVARGTAEVRVEAPAPGDDGTPAVVLFATEGTVGMGGDGSWLDPTVGLQLWAEGDAVGELDAWPDGSGAWRGHLHLEGDGGG